MNYRAKILGGGSFPAVLACAMMFVFAATACAAPGKREVKTSTGLAREDAQRAAARKVVARHKLLITAYEFGVTRNVDVAAKKLDYFVLAPGASFSLNKFLGKRTEDKGYKKAPVYAGAGARIKDFGGGLCMVSSVLYNIFLRGGLEILERHPHRKIVNYVPAGLDAAVDWGSKDLRVRNNQPHALVLRVYREGKVVHGELMGPAHSPHEIEIKRHLSRAIIPGVLRNGFRVRTTRTFFDGRGELLREEILSEDTFLPINYQGAPDQ